MQNPHFLETNLIQDSLGGIEIEGIELQGDCKDMKDW